MINATRNLIAARVDKCHPDCPGWYVFDHSARGFEVERCDECFSGTDLDVTDEDVAELPEAKAALTSTLLMAGWLNVQTHSSHVWRPAA